MVRIVTWHGQSELLRLAGDESMHQVVATYVGRANENHGSGRRVFRSEQGHFFVAENMNCSWVYMGTTTHVSSGCSLAITRTAKGRRALLIERLSCLVARLYHHSQSFSSKTESHHIWTTLTAIIFKVWKKTKKSKFVSNTIFPGRKQSIFRKHA